VYWINTSVRITSCHRSGQLSELTWGTCETADWGCSCDCHSNKNEELQWSFSWEIYKNNIYNF